MNLLKQVLHIILDESLSVESLGNHLRVFANLIDSDKLLDEAVEVLDRASVPLHNRATPFATFMVWPSWIDSRL